MTKQETFSGLREFRRRGRYFVLLSTVNSVDVTAYASDGRVLSDEKQVSTGYEVDRRGVMVDERSGKIVNLEPFDRIEITTGGSEAVKFAITDGRSAFSGTSDISDRVTRQLGALSGRAHSSTGQIAGAVSAIILVANAARSYLSIQNQSATEDVYLSTDGGAATVNNGSFKLGPGESFEPRVPPTAEIRAIRGGGVDANLHVIEAS